MSVHPLWRPFETPTQEQTDSAFVSGTEPRVVGGRVAVVAYDPAWPAAYARIADAIHEALDGRAIAVAHTGSTSVPGLAAKPIIDVDLIVADPADEPSYVPPLERLGYVLRIREPWWEQHRMLRLDDPLQVNLHVFGPDAAEPRRHLLFRERLLADDADRTAYARLKEELATREFGTVMAYNAAKARLIYEIYEHAFAADPDHPHDPQPID
ncbi:GrpB family protein [Mumia zhuanghuii]|uniref:GrpB family protein n=2 Tax=Mumia TaxID=1546255 RepID=A0ABW1QKI2_9ACTN|nr:MULTISPECIES: GrpB family protein [Mumia]KAA1419927.1 GrpB family protein [Mumia zhuanghuii]